MVIKRATKTGPSVNESVHCVVEGANWLCLSTRSYRRVCREGEIFNNSEFKQGINVSGQLQAPVALTPWKQASISTGKERILPSFCMRFWRGKYQIRYLIYLLTPWCRIHFEKL